ncbi:hypothetical protein BGW39_009315 [Mortierella sp. 14UC]|nr:hypothetical protein BGW39_009315 [Mortierella sp. 14UC]
MVHSDTRVDPDVLTSLFKFFPELTSMDIPTVVGDDPDFRFRVAEVIVSACPKLKSLRKRDIMEDEEKELAFAFLDSMKKDTLESLEFAWYSEETEEISWALVHHIKSVRSLVFEECREISDASVSWMLRRCPTLETFKISPAFGLDAEVVLPLGSLTKQTWASNKFQELQLCVHLDEVQELPGEKELFFSDPMPHWTIDLERFYRQIGALTQLRVLDLKVSVDSNARGPDGYYLAYKDKSLTGMLTLEDRNAGRLGWLRLLEDLKNLEEFHGSFNVDAMQARFEFGQREADWIVDHWPKLKFIELYTKPEDTAFALSPPVLSMVTRLPGLNVCGAFSGAYVQRWG